MARIRDLQRRTEELFLSAGSAESLAESRTSVRFSPFVPEHVEGALELVDRWIALTESGRGNAGLEAALAEGRFPTIADDLRLYRRVAQMDSDAPVPELTDQTPTWARGAERARELGLNALAKRLLERA